MKKKIKRYMQTMNSGFEIKSVSALINGIKYTFTRENIFNSLGEKLG